MEMQYSNDRKPGGVMRNNSTITPLKLPELVKRYRVIWSLLPIHLPSIMRGHRIGFELELWGTHDHPRDFVGGECVECAHVVEVLREIATWISPRECAFRAGGRAVETRATFHPRNGFGSSVRFSTGVACRAGYNAVHSQCDSDCLGKMRDKLLSIGARRA